MNSVPLFKVRMNASSLGLVDQTLQSGFIGQGARVEELEDLLWDKMGTYHRPITVNSCTSALDLALHLCDVGPGDVVISTPVTCFATNSVIINRGANIVWADVDPHTFCINPDSIAGLVDLPNVKCIMAVDWAGRACDYTKIRSFTDLPVIEDAAHCWDTRMSHIGMKPITRQGGDYVCYSLQAIKFLTASDGGILICPSEEKAELARLLRWYGLDRTKGQNFRCAQNIQHSGYKYHMNDVCASIALGNLPGTLESVYQHRINAAQYDQTFMDLDTITIPPPDPGCSYWLYSLKVEQGTKEDFMSHLESKGIASSPVHHRNDLYDCTSKFRRNGLYGVDEFARKQVSIPVGSWLTEEDKERIIEAVKSYNA